MYFGDISYLFNLRNQYVYQCKERETQVFSIDTKHLELMLNRFEKFRKVMEVRAYRR